MQPNDRKLRDEYKKLTDLNKEQKTSLGSKISNFISGGIYDEKKTNVKKQRKYIKKDKLPPFDPTNPQCYYDF